MSLPTHYRVRESVECEGVYLNVEDWAAVRETPEGYWIKAPYSPCWFNEAELRKAKLLKWVSKTSHKRYAYPDFDSALTSFKRRKEVQVSRLRLQLEVAQLALSKFDEYKGLSPENVRGNNLGRTSVHGDFVWD